MRKVTPSISVLFFLCMFFWASGCSQPGASGIEQTRKTCKPAEVRAAVLPIFADYRYDSSAPEYGHPNYRELKTIPPGVGALPLFSGLKPGEWLSYGALKQDTNALIVFAQVGMDKWGLVVHRDAKVTQIPSEGVETFSLWGDGVFFFRGSAMP